MDLEAELGIDRRGFVKGGGRNFSEALVERVTTCLFEERDATPFDLALPFQVGLAAESEAEATAVVLTCMDGLWRIFGDTVEAEAGSWRTEADRLALRVEFEERYGPTWRRLTRQFRDAARRGHRTRGVLAPLVESASAVRRRGRATRRP